MSRFVTALSAGIIAAALAGGTAFMPTPAAAANTSDADKAALKKATADCRAQVKEEAHYEEMSWYKRHKMVKSCVKDALAHPAAPAAAPAAAPSGTPAPAAPSAPAPGH